MRKIILELVLSIAVGFLSGCGSDHGGWGFNDRDRFFDDPHLRELKYKWEEENGRRSW